MDFVHVFSPASRDRILVHSGTVFAYNIGVLRVRMAQLGDERTLWKEGSMDEVKLEDQLNELVKQFADTGDPRHAKLAELAREAEANRKRLQKSIDTLQEVLDYLRICIKYQTFDLEATRRENDYLRKLLEEKDRQEEE